MAEDNEAAGAAGTTAAGAAEGDGTMGGQQRGWLALGVRLRRHPEWVLCALMGLLGCVAIGSVTLAGEQPHYFLLRQLVWLGLGLVVLAVATPVTRDTWLRFTPWVAGASLALLYVVLVLGGPPRQGVHGWFQFNVSAGGPYFKEWLLQPGELAKPGYILFLAWVLGRPAAERRFGWPQYGAALGWAALWWLPLALQPDWGTATLYLLTFAIAYWLQGGHLKHLAATAAVVVVAVAAAWWRWPAWRDHCLGGWPGAANSPADGPGWHALQSQAALASGGWHGQLGAPPLVARYFVPGAHTQAMGATVGETVGLVGIVILLLALLGWLLYLLNQARRQDHLRGALVIGATAGMVGTQVLLHLSAAAGLLPTSGVPLPFFSYGGSSLIATLLLVTLVTSFAREGARR